MFNKIIDWIKSIFDSYSKIQKNNSTDEATLNAEISLFQSANKTTQTSKNKYKKSELNKMTKSKLLILAKEEFNLEYNEKINKQKIINDILNV
jgi:hypothetical protein